jgi:hypothetical protein
MTGLLGCSQQFSCVVVYKPQCPLPPPLMPFLSFQRNTTAHYPIITISISISIIFFIIIIIPSLLLPSHW